MGKVGFWLVVGFVAIIEIYVFKLLAGASGNDGLKKFAAGV